MLYVAGQCYLEVFFPNMYGGFFPIRGFSTGFFFP